MTTSVGKRFIRSLLRIAIALAIICSLVGCVAWWWWVPYTFEPGTAASASDVSYYTKVTVPPDAHGFAVAAFRYHVLRLAYVRFSAPPETCRQYAQAIIGNETLKPVDSSQQDIDSQCISNDRKWLHGLTWFDYPNPKNGAIIGADTSARRPEYDQTSVRVDVDNGVFYFFQEN